ncbi:MAG TPA: hypothetical protein VJ623_15950 [Holophagaceae bacterium]|nr:hypothetical protein [Holophagaceae bacterium]
MDNPMDPMKPKRSPTRIAAFVTIALVGAGILGLLLRRSAQVALNTESIESSQPRLHLPDSLKAHTPHISDLLEAAQRWGKAHGIGGWPDPQSADDRRWDFGDPLANRMWAPQTVQWFADSTGEKWTALYLTTLEGASLDRIIVRVEDPFGSPVFSLPFGKRPMLQGGDGFQWREGEESDWSRADAPVPGPFSPIAAPRSSAFLNVGPAESDNIIQMIFHPDHGLAIYVEGLTDSNGKLEGVPEEEQDNPHGTVISRKDWMNSQITGRTKKFIWFTSGNSVLATYMKDWNQWKAGPSSPLPAKPQ